MTCPIITPLSAYIATIWPKWTPPEYSAGNIERRAYHLADHAARYDLGIISIPLIYDAGSAWNARNYLAVFVGGVYTPHSQMLDILSDLAQHKFDIVADYAELHTRVNKNRYDPGDVAPMGSLIRKLAAIQ